MPDVPMTWRKYLRYLVGKALPPFFFLSIAYLATYLSSSKAMPIVRTLAVGMIISTVLWFPVMDLLEFGAKRLNIRFLRGLSPKFGYLFIGFYFALGFCIASLFWTGKVSWLLAAYGGAILIACIAGGAVKVIADFLTQWFDSRRQRRR
jgi:hypothetical protein